MDCSPPSSSIHGILQARVLESLAISFSNDTTNEPDEKEIEVAIASVKKLLEAEHPEIEV